MVPYHKEACIIDTLEHVLNTHRLVVDQKIVEADRKQESKVYSLFYQLSHITRKPTPKHDDRPDVLAMAIEYWTEELKRDEDQARKDYELQEIQGSLDWYDSIGIRMGSNDGHRLARPEDNYILLKLIHTQKSSKFIF